MSDAVGSPWSKGFTAPGMGSPSSPPPQGWVLSIPTAPRVASPSSPLQLPSFLPPDGTKNALAAERALQTQGNQKAEQSWQEAWTSAVSEPQVSLDLGSSPSTCSGTCLGQKPAGGHVIGLGQSVETVHQSLQYAPLCF